MHFLNNGFSVVVLYINQNYLHIPMESQASYAMPPVASIMFAFLFGGVIIYLGSLCFKEKEIN